MTIYSKKFFKGIQKGSYNSASEVVPIVMGLLKPKSVVDVGCGIGSWLSVFREYGIEDILGIDGEYVDSKMLMIPSDKFKHYDLKFPISVSRKFDLVISLEVAEHIPEEYAEIFINSLTELGHVILFSAAIPYQGGTNHINEQWPDYWVELFKKKNYCVIDCIRSKIWNNDNVEYWYIQNMLLFIRQDCLKNYPLLIKDYENTCIDKLVIVHPILYLKKSDPSQMGIISGSLLRIYYIINKLLADFKRCLYGIYEFCRK